MTRTRLLLAGASGLSLLAASPALAQTGVPPAPSPDNTVQSIVVTASRSGDALSADLLGASATVITAPELEDRQTRVVSDVLRDVPGVAVNRTGAVGGLTQVRLRGSEANQTLVLVDGIKVSDPYTGEFDFGTLLADEDARIEVLRGQQSSLYGSDAIGGVIQYFTLTGAEAPGVELRAGGGSMGTFEGAARVAGVKGNLDYAFSASGLTTDGYPTAIGGSRDVGSQNLGATGKVIWSPIAELHLTGVFRYSRTDADTNDSDQAFGSPTFGLTIDSPGVHSVNDAYYGLVRGQLDSLGGRWTNAVVAQIADTRRTDFDVLDPYSTIAGQAVDKSFGDHGQRLRGSYESSLRLGDADTLQQRFTFAADGQQERARTTVSTFGAFTGYRYTTNVGVVGEYELTGGDRFALGGSVRQDFNDRFSDSTTYRVQGSYRLPLAVRIHAAGGSGVVDPTFGDLFDIEAGRFTGNPDLKPEKSEGWEVGLERTFLNGEAHVAATYFDNRATDQIATSYATGVASPINLPGSTPQRGVELSAFARFAHAFRLDLAYTYLDAPQPQDVLLGGTVAMGGVDTAYTGEAVRRARNTASANLTWAPAGPFSATLTVRYNGSAERPRLHRSVV